MKRFFFCFKFSGEDEKRKLRFLLLTENVSLSCKAFWLALAEAASNQTVKGELSIVAGVTQRGPFFLELVCGMQKCDVGIDIYCIYIICICICI